MDRAAIEIALDRGLTMDLLPETSRLFRDEERHLPRTGSVAMFSRTISRVPIGQEPFAACTFNVRLLLRRSLFVCCAGAFSMWLSIFAVRHQASAGILPSS